MAEFQFSNEQVFTEIYKSGKWGAKVTDEQPFYSGPGSYGENAKEYVAFLTAFIKQNEIKAITDIGCGDFAIGSQIVKQNPAIKYNGCDVVRDLIEYNNEKYGTSSVKFFQIDAANGTIPAADLITVRQVLQHLSNAEISKVLNNIKSFKYVLVTEHQLKEGTEISFNKDKKTNADYRLSEGSAVYLDKSPFYIACEEVFSCREDVYVENPDIENDWIKKEAFLRTFLIKNF